MRPTGGSNPDNPFSYRRRRWYESGVWWFGIIVLVVAGSYAIPHASKLYLLVQLSNDIDNPLSDAHSGRIEALGQLGADGLPVLIKVLAHEDIAVARSASQTIQHAQATAMEKVNYQRELINQLSLRITEIPLGRWYLIRPLVEQTLADTLNNTSDEASGVYRDASMLLTRIGSELPQTDAQPTVIAADQPTTARPEELQRPVVSMAIAPNQANNDQQTIQPGASTGRSKDAFWQSVPATTTFASDNLVTTQAIIQPAMITREVAETSQRVHQPGLPIGQASRVLVADEVTGGNPLAAYSTRAVIDLLSSVRPESSTRARDELVSRGFSQEELILAIRLASSNASVRSALIDELPHRTDVDPRRWLFWLAEDGEQSVRVKALSALATMNDPNVARQLQNLLLSEPDKIVASQIRDAIVR